MLTEVVVEEELHSRDTALGGKRQSSANNKSASESESVLLAKYMYT